MKTLVEILATEPRDLFGIFIGVIEYDTYSVVGVVDEPMGVDSREARISYPVEFVNRLNNESGTTVNTLFIMPEYGIPEERLTDGQLDLYRGNSPIGIGYFGALKKIKDSQVRYAFDLILRPKKKEGS